CIVMDRRVLDFVTRYQYKQSNKNLSIDDKMKIIQQAIDEKRELEIVYLKTTDDKSCRVIIPEFVGQMQYNGREFIGVRGYCTLKDDVRVFHLGRILDIKTK
ncbi:MAG: WYL domain-containing protein, partial [Thermodesulfovibrionales bacterium]